MKLIILTVYIYSNVFDSSIRMTQRRVLHSYSLQLKLMHVPHTITAFVACALKWYVVGTWRMLVIVLYLAPTYKRW